VSEQSSTRSPLDLGDGHIARFAYYEDEISGCNIQHKRKDGTDCDGWVPWKGRAWDRSFDGKITSWDLVSEEPLTLSPSVLCRACGDHGFVQQGKWVRA
jgi:hypothetical protein